jgi:murein L,D-transpeptidase YafK
MKSILLIFILAIIGFVAYYCFSSEVLPKNAKIDKMLVLKSKRLLLVYSRGELLKTYSVSLGNQPIGAKKFEGDRKTPEGIYTIHAKNANSGYHKNLGVSYPNDTDIKMAKKLGKPTGGDIKVHGLKNGLGFIGKLHRWNDWTLGCIALTNSEIDELYEIVPIGTKIEIKP